MELKGKRVLFFSPSFFGYEEKIKDKLEQQGAYVNLYDTRPTKNSFLRSMIKVSPNLAYVQCKKYYESILQKEKNEQYNYILVIKCDLIPCSILKKIKNMYPNAKLCLYLYDSLKDIPQIYKKLKYFDVINSFDDVDCKNHAEIGFRPLFFSDEYKRTDDRTNKSYDISFCGTIHTDRFRIIRMIVNQCKLNGLKYYFYPYLQSNFIYYFYKITKIEFRGVRKKFFKYDKLSADKISHIVSSSKAILDMESPGQNGLTMRTIEILGMQKKLVTTNSRITKYDFYNPENILLIDRSNPIIKKEFFENTYVTTDKDIYEKYSLDEFVKDLFNKCERFEVR